MDLRHLRYFVAVAEELHFTRAAARLHIEQPSLSRAIRDLEADLRTLLFERTRRGTTLTWAGQRLLTEARQLLAAAEQLRTSVLGAANGYRGRLRIALSDGVTQPRLAALLSQCRAEEPEVEISLFEVPLAEQTKGLRDGSFDAGLVHTPVNDGIVAQPMWSDPIVIAVPALHPLLTHKHIPLAEALRFPLVLCDPQAYAGSHRQIELLLRTVDTDPTVAARAATTELMLTLIGAGYGIGFINAARMSACRYPNVVVRELAGQPPMLTTYLLHRESKPSEPLQRFIDRVRAMLGQGHPGD